MTEFTDSFPHLAHHLAEPVRVQVVGSDVQETTKHAPDFGSPFAVSFAGNEPATRLVPMSAQRDKASFLIGAGAAGNTVGVVYIGTKEQLDNLNSASSGVYRLAYGQSVTWGSQQPCYARPDGINSLTVNVLDERWR